MLEIINENTLLIAAVWVIMATVKRFIPKLWRQRWWAKFSPLIPIAICSAAVWIPGVAPSGTPPAKIVLLGVVLGSLAGQGHKIFRQTVFEDDQRLRPDSRPPLDGPK